MASILKNYEFRAPTGVGAPPIYPWDRWMDGQIRKINCGQDFRCARLSMNVQLRQQASKRGGRVQIRNEGPEHSGHIIFQFYTG